MSMAILRVSWMLMVATSMLLSPASAQSPPDRPPVVLGPDSVTVTAGAPGSLAVVAGPRPSRAAVRCTWHELVVRPDGSATSRPARPVPGDGFVLWCLHPDDSVVAGYPILVVYDPADPVPGAAVSTEETARFALRSIAFDPPAPVLSPAARQVVGVETWLAIVSRLAYGEVTAQAGPVWSSVRPVFRDVEWRLGDGGTVVCSDDAATVWERGVHEGDQASDCTHVYHRSSDAGGYAATATATWAILWRNDRDPLSWEVFDTLSLTTALSIAVDDLQAAIR